MWKNGTKHLPRDFKFSYLQISTVLGDLWAYTSDFKIISPLRGNHALESNVFAHKFLRLSLHKKLQRDNLLHAYNRPIEIIQCSVGLHSSITYVYSKEKLL